MAVGRSTEASPTRAPNPMWAALRVVLEYPRPALGQAVQTLIAGCANQLPQAAAWFRNFQDVLVQQGLAYMEECYTAAFDFAAESAPYVGYQIFGDDPRRSLFMAQLRARYQEHGVEAGVELPDHLALVLPWLALAPDREEAEELLAEMVLPAIEKMCQQLQKQANPYEALLRGIALWVAGQGQRVANRRAE